MPDDRTELRREQARAALIDLIEGNERYRSGEPMVPRRVDPDSLVSGQHPKAVVIGCVDARVPPELILGQGVDDLLTVRTAGQALSGVAMGSLDFGVRVLGVPLLVVLGHTGCGAVLAAQSGRNITGYLGELVHEVGARLVDIVGDDPIAATGGNVSGTVEALRAFGLTGPKGEPVHVVGLLHGLADEKIQILDDDGLLDAPPESSEDAERSEAGTEVTG